MTGGIGWSDVITDAVIFVGYVVSCFFVLYLLNNGNSRGREVYGARELQFSHNMGSRPIIPMPLSTIFYQLPLYHLRAV